MVSPSKMLTLGRADASIALLSLNRIFHGIRLNLRLTTSGSRLPLFLSGQCKGGARRTQSRARSNYAEPQPTLAEHFPNALQRYNIFRHIPNFRPRFRAISNTNSLNFHEP